MYPIVYALALKYSLYRYIGPKVYTVWVHGPLGNMYGRWGTEALKIQSSKQPFEDWAPNPPLYLGLGQELRSSIFRGVFDY